MSAQAMSPATAIVGAVPAVGVVTVTVLLEPEMFPARSRAFTV